MMCTCTFHTIIYIYIYMNYDWCHKSLFQLGQLYRIANTSHCFCLDILLTTEAVCRLHNEFKCSERCYMHTILKINWNKMSVLVWYIITVQTFIFNVWFGLIYSMHSFVHLARYFSFALVENNNLKKFVHLDSNLC